MLTVFALLAMIAAAALLVWSGLCAWRGSNRFLKWGGVGLAAVLVVAVSCVAALTIVGMVKQHARGAPVPDLKVEATPERIARAQGPRRWLSRRLPFSTPARLTGGLDIGEDFPTAIGSFVSSNLTPVGRLKHWSDGEIFRAIRNSVDATGVG